MLIRCEKFFLYSVLAHVLYSNHLQKFIQFSSIFLFLSFLAFLDSLLLPLCFPLLFYLLEVISYLSPFLQYHLFCSSLSPFCILSLYVIIIVLNVLISLSCPSKQAFSLSFLFGPAVLFPTSSKVLDIDSQHTSCFVLILSGSIYIFPHLFLKLQFHAPVFKLLSINLSYIFPLF